MKRYVEIDYEGQTWQWESSRITLCLFLYWDGTQLNGFFKWNWRSECWKVFFEGNSDKISVMNLFLLYLGQQLAAFFEKLNQSQKYNAFWVQLLAISQQLSEKRTRLQTFFWNLSGIKRKTLNVMQFWKDCSENQLEFIVFYDLYMNLFLMVIVAVGWAFLMFQYLIFYQKGKRNWLECQYVCRIGPFDLLCQKLYLKLPPLQNCFFFWNKVTLDV